MASPSLHSCAAIILAAGLSRRFGAENKLTASLNGRSILSHVIDLITPLPFAQKIMVCTPDQQECAPLASPHDIDIIWNHQAQSGMGTSIAAAVKTLKGVNSVMIMLGDMPFIHSTTIEALFASSSPEASASIYAPTYQGKRGHPVLFTACHFDALSLLSTDKGASTILSAHQDKLHLVPVNDQGVIIDIDHPDDLEKYTSLSARHSLS